MRLSGSGRGAVRPRVLPWLAVVLVAAGVVGCGDGSTEVPPTRPPMVVATAPDLELAVGEAAELDALAYFSDPEGGVLTYEARSSNPEVATAAASGGTVRVTAVARGTATVAVTARDPEGRAAAIRFEVTVPNRAPVAAGPIPDLELAVGDTARVDVAAHFGDPDGDPLVYAAASSDDVVAVAGPVGDAAEAVWVAGMGRGRAEVTVTARDPGGLAAELSFSVEVRRARGDFDITLHFGDAATAPRRAAVREAAERWMEVLAETELPAVPVEADAECHGLRSPATAVTVDDLMILVAFEDIDGPGRTLARAGPCRLREGSLLPHLAAVFFDVGDFDDLIASGDATELALHEIAHALGFGLLWPAKDLLRDRSLGVGAIDAHFVGPLAIKAFDAAGGTAYTGGAKVPVENLGGSGTANLHWRGGVLRGELMRPRNALGAREAFSAVTIQSMADLGYVVDAGLAAPYTLPAAAAADETPERAVDIGDDGLTGPLIVVNATGSVVRVLSNRW